jgi:hypothetical protein
MARPFESKWWWQLPMKLARLSIQISGKGRFRTGFFDKKEDSTNFLRTPIGRPVFVARRKAACDRARNFIPNGARNTQLP